MRVIAMSLLVGALAACAAAPVGRQVALPAATGGGQCSCAGATASYNLVACDIASGGAMLRPQRCYTKRTAGGEACGTSCEPAEDVCSGRLPAGCR